MSILASGQMMIPPPADSDGHPITRTKFAPTGWTYQHHAIEFETCKLASIYNKDHAGTDLGFTTIKLYNSSDTEITDQTTADLNCVKTVVDWEPTWNYEVVGGSVATQTILQNDMRVWLVGVPDLTEAQGGSKTFINGLNLIYLKDKTFFKIDGRTSKLLNYSATYHTNKLRVIVRTAAGEKNKTQAAFEVYRP